MTQVLAVYQKELWQYFRSPIAYFVVAVFLIGTGYFFTYNIFLTGVATMNETFQSMGVLAVMLLPALSMRLFAAEYNDGTIELLQTLPLRPWQLVMGKFLGTATIFSLIIVCTFIDLIPLFLFAEPDTATIISGYIGFFLLGLTALAIGQFFSGLTENQIVAALLTLSVLLAFWFVGHLQNFQSIYFLRDLFGYLSFADHFGEFIRGLVRSDAVGFFVLTTALALALNVQYLHWRR